MSEQTSKISIICQIKTLMMEISQKMIFVDSSLKFLADANVVFCNDDQVLLRGYFRQIEELLALVLERIPELKS